MSDDDEREHHHLPNQQEPTAPTMRQCDGDDDSDGEKTSTSSNSSTLSTSRSFSSSDADGSEEDIEAPRRHGAPSNSSSGPGEQRQTSLSQHSSLVTTPFRYHALNICIGTTAVLFLIGCAVAVILSNKSASEGRLGRGAARPPEEEHTEPRTLLEIAQDLSDPEDLETFSSPQYRALVSLSSREAITDDEFTGGGDSTIARRDTDDYELVQRYVLSILYFSSTSDCLDAANPFHMAVMMGIDNRQNVCDWNIFQDWVTCDDAGSSKQVVIKSLLNMGSSDSSCWNGGTIPKEVGALTSLTTLNLRGNRLKGNIPAELFQLTNLQSLDLSENSLGGSIPADVFALTKLTHLDLSDNQLGGAVPSYSLNRWTSLKELYLQGNQLTGRISGKLCFSSKASIEHLWSDCGDPTLLTCDCCDKCF